MPGHPDYRPGSQTASVYHKISAASTNADTAKASPGIVTGYFLVNEAGAFRYVKLYNKASNPTVGTDVPRCVWGVPPTSAANVNLSVPIAFETGIAIAIVVGMPDSDATAVGANEVAVTLHFI